MFKKKRSYFLICMVISCLTKAQEPQIISLRIDSLFGSVTITEPVLIDLLQSKAVLRLKEINQYGVNFYTKKQFSYTRYDHSVGVMILLRTFNAELKEQIAGLLHDASHTAFSHVADYLYKVGDRRNSYQDSIHEWYLEQTDIPQILQKHGMTLQDILHKKGCFKALECDLPNICGDRIEYILHGTFLENRASQADIAEILNALEWDTHIGWYFKTLKAARAFGDYSLRLCEEHFGAAWNFYQNTLAAKLLERAIELNLIDFDQIHFGTDGVIWKKLLASDDAVIQKILDALLHGEPEVLESNEGADMHALPKFRGVNPLIKTESGMISLVALDEAYAAEYQRIKEVMNKGWYIFLGI